MQPRRGCPILLIRPPSFGPCRFGAGTSAWNPPKFVVKIALMKAGGWGGAFIHSRIGLLTPYLGEEWFAACDAVMEACREHGMLVWLYDEDKWPSGYSGGSVPLADAEFRFKTLIARPVGAPVPDGCAPLGEATNDLQAYVWTSALGDPWFNGTCYADLMNRDAMRKFLDDAYQPYFDRYGELYGDLIRAEFTDEPTTAQRSRLPVGSVPFTGELPAKFAQMWNYDPLPQLHLLFEDVPGCERFRLHYFRVTNELFERNFSQQLGEWCDDHGIALTGHYILEGDLYHQQLWGSKLMPNYRHQGIPGIDHLGRQITERITAKQCQSVANQYGKRRMLSELYGVAGGALTFEDRFWIASQQIVLGVNLLNPHLSLYTMAGCRKRDYPCNIFYQQPWWPLNKAVDDPLSRLCVALSQGKFRAEALVIHPQESTFALWESRAILEGDDQTRIGSDWSPVTDETQTQIQQLGRDIDMVIDGLLGAQRTFDLGDETILADDGSVVMCDGAAVLRVGQMDYRAVVLPSMETMAPATLSLLEEFGNAGGLIARCGRAPRWLDGEPSERLESLAAKRRRSRHCTTAVAIGERVFARRRSAGFERRRREDAVGSCPRFRKRRALGLSHQLEPLPRFLGEDYAAWRLGRRSRFGYSQRRATRFERTKNGRRLAGRIRFRAHAKPSFVPGARQFQPQRHSSHAARVRPNRNRRTERLERAAIGR